MVGCGRRDLAIKVATDRGASGLLYVRWFDRNVSSPVDPVDPAASEAGFMARTGHNGVDLT
jgi:hypothetical protein